MMKNQDSYAVAVRRPDGEIELKKEDYKGIWGDKKITKIPFLRGVFNFIDSLVLGMSTLTWSAQFFEEDEPEKNIADQKKKAKKPEQKETVSDAVTEKRKNVRNKYTKHYGAYRNSVRGQSRYMCKRGKLYEIQKRD